MKKQFNKQLLSLLLVFCLIFGMAAPAAAVSGQKLTFTKVDNSAVSSSLLTKVDDELHGATEYLPTDMVRVSIFLDDQSTIMAGYSTDNIAANGQAVAYRADLKAKQETVTAAIEKAIGNPLDVVWNLTLAANLISANVQYGQIGKIEQVKGVSKVILENCYEPAVVKENPVNDPNMGTSSAQIGSTAAWAAGYTGAGSRIAVIDTGVDTDHQSMNADAFQYALAHAAGSKGMDVEAYMEQIDLLDADEIDAVADQLNAPVTGSEAYINSKIPFGYNYIDGDLDITHDNDAQGGHGSHVSGIATANAWLYQGEDNFVAAEASVMTQGVAPDAQLITMKVFGKGGGAYDSDYMAAIEDAVVLGCDAANLSLGSANPGSSKNTNETYQAILDSLSEAGIVVAMSAGNSGYWAEAAYNAGYLYSDDVSMTTAGSPGSFTNSLGVASVENDGKIGYYVTVDGMMVVYNETTGYSNAPFTTIAGEHEYVFVDAIGTPEDWAKAGDALAGKIALCWRGETSFFEKADAAAEAGAIGVFICNNQPGIINMDLTDYSHTAPCASLIQADAQAILAASTPVTDADGNVLYYTGTMEVGTSMGAGIFNSTYYTMSTFSSWGVPGSLELKPEVTAPGGNIYSIDGEPAETDKYTTMSGTSMASPQVAGMAAVVAQYIAENDLVAKTGLSARQLSQSLLMSTAVPLSDANGAYYSVMQQGAGLANVGAATSADSYITMADGSNAGAADGKVKVELGDDPAKNGEYTATFTIHNMEDAEKNFDLSADFFIQAPTMDGEGNLYMHTSTALIGADVTWTVDGEELAPVSGLNGMDFNGDGNVNSDDGQALLDYATGAAADLTNMDKADLDADGDVDSYDAYLFLNALTAGTATVAAGGSATVTVTMKLSDDWKDTLDYYYPNGTYIEGYIYAMSLTDAEGNAGTTHSIPVLGFFGNWTDPSMFDVGTYQTFSTGDETRAPYLGNVAGNTWAVTYADEPGVKYYLGGNPLVPDETYLPERNAINSNDTIVGLNFISIRNAAASKFYAANLTTGEVMAENGELGPIDGAYYYSNGGVWRNTGSTLNTALSAVGGSEGDQIYASLTLVPEYYVDAEGTVNWDALGKGSTFDIGLTVDNTAPELFDVTMSLTGKTMTVTASDNEYVAAVALFNKSGSKVLAAAGSKLDVAKGEVADFTFDISEVNGKNFLLQVCDYAMNTTTYRIEMQIGEEQPLPELIAFDLDKNYWTTFDQNSAYTDLYEYASSDLTFFAATIVDHYVLAVTADGDLYVMPESDLEDLTYVTNIGTIVTDMAYNAADGLVYGINADNALVTIDKLNGAVEVIGTVGVLTNTLACDSKGTFYCNEYGTGNVYSYTVETLDAPTMLVEAVADGDGYEIETSYVQSMEVNPNNGMLCWASYYDFYGLFGFSYYVEIDTKTRTYTTYEDLWDELSCLIITQKSSGGGWTAPTDEVSELSLNTNSLKLLKGSTAQLSAAILPWTASDRSVTWTSSDESIVTVDENGLVTALNNGTATVTATSNLDPSFTATCDVVVELLEVTMTGTLQDAEGNPLMYTWNMAEENTWSKVVDLDTSMISATDNGTDTLYVMDASAFSMKEIDLVTGETLKTYANATGAPMADMSFSGQFTTEEADSLNLLYWYYMFPAQNPANLNGMGFNFSSYLASYSGGNEFVGIATVGSDDYVTNDGTVVTAEYSYMLDDAGYLWEIAVYPNGESSFGAGLAYIPSDIVDAGYALTYDENFNPLSSLVMGNDGNFYFSGYNGETNVLYRLEYSAEDAMFVTTVIGNVGADVWPATLLSVSSNAIAEGNAFENAEKFAIETAEYSFKEILAERKGSSMAQVAKVDNTAKPTSDSEVAADEKTVTVTVTAEELATNGVATVSWDADALTLDGMMVHGDYTSKVMADDSVTFGYVALNGIEAGNAIATLTFTAKKTDATTITIEHKQLNNAAGATETVNVEFAHANTEVKNAVAATCTTDGYTGDVWCLDCGVMIEEGKVIPATGHDFGEWTIVTAATCTTDGLMTRTCATCGHTESEVISADCASEQFVDVALTAWYHDAVDFVVDNGLMNGMSKTIFNPEGQMDRAMMVTVLYRMADSPDVNAKMPFTDVPANAYYADALAWAYSNGIVNGFTATSFNPSGTVTREQMVTFLARFAELFGADMTTKGNLSAYNDAADVSGWAEDAMVWAVENGVIAGLPGNMLKPADATNRAQIATVLMRMFA